MKLTYEQTVKAFKEIFMNEAEPEKVKELITEDTPTLKALDEDQRLFTCVVLRPEVTDSQGHIYDEKVVEKACHDFNEHCRQGNVQHQVNTDVVVPVESWIAKADQTLGAGHIKVGDWVMTARIDDDELWGMCKDGTFNSFSCGNVSSMTTLKAGEDQLVAWAKTLKAQDPDSAHRAWTERLIAKEAA